MDLISFEPYVHSNTFLSAVRGKQNLDINLFYFFFSLCRLFFNGWAAVFNRFIFLLVNEML